MENAVQYVTKNEFDVRMKNQQERTDMQISAMREMFEKYMDNLRAVSDKNLAELKAANAEMRADFADFRMKINEDLNEIRGDVKALNAKVDSIQMKFGWYLVLFSVAVSVALFLFQKI